jgi:serine/threonine-protein kinase
MPSSRDPHARKSFSLLALGGCTLVDTTGIVMAGQRRRLALLVLVASGRERGVSRDKLIAALSPESPTDSARHALHQLLYYLRQRVGEDAFLGTDPLRLNRDVVAFDVEEFEAAIDAGALERAAVLYRGPFLDGFHLNDSAEFEEWAAGERSRLAAKHADALGRLAEAATARGDHPAACVWWRRLTELDPLAGRAALGLARSLAASGDRAGAVRHARLHENLVRAELGGEPEPELASLVVELQRADHLPAREVVTAEAPVVEPRPDTVSGAAGATGSRGAGKRLLAAAMIFLVALASAGAWLRGRPDADDAADADLLAVAPFEVLDPSLQLWREGMSDLLPRTLDGAGPIRTVPATVVLRRWNGRVDRPSADELGRRTGAGLVVYGAVISRGRDSVTLRAELLDRVGGLGRTEFEVSGETDRIGELTDSLGVRVLRVLSAGRTIGSVPRTWIGSRSVLALKAFLQGEQFYRRGLWDSALTRYDRAIAADSTFALAMVRMGLVLGWNPPTTGSYAPPDEYWQRAVLHNHGLPARDSLLLVADSFRLAAEGITDPEAWARMWLRALTPVEEAVRRYPEDPMVWYELGEWRMNHEPWPIAGPPSVSLAAFTRAIALDPGFAPSYEHLPDLLLSLGRVEEARRAAATYLALDPTSPNRSDLRLAALLLDPSDSASAAAEEMLDTASVFTIWLAALRLNTWPDTAETAIRLMRRLGDPGRNADAGPPWVRDSAMWPQYLASPLQARGHLREAFVADERLLHEPSASPWSGFLDPFPTLSLLGVVPESLARATYSRALASDSGWSDTFTPRHLRGLPWWLSRGDTAALAQFAGRAARVARAPPNPRTGLRARLLGETSVAFLDLARGDSVAALRKLSAIPDTLCLADWYTSDCFHLNLTLARLLEARGEHRRAGERLERWRWSAGGGGLLFTLATLELGRIAERLGERAKAAEHYGFVVETWRRPDPELMPSVVEAREALVRLGVE